MYIELNRCLLAIGDGLIHAATGEHATDVQVCGVDEQLADCSLPFPILQEFLGRGKDRLKPPPLLAVKPPKDCPLTVQFFPHSFYFKEVGYFKKLSEIYRKIEQEVVSLSCTMCLIIIPYTSVENF